MAPGGCGSPSANLPGAMTECVTKGKRHSRSRLSSPGRDGKTQNALGVIRSPHTGFVNLMAKLIEEIPAPTSDVGLIFLKPVPEFLKRRCSTALHGTLRVKMCLGVEEISVDERAEDHAQEEFRFPLKPLACGTR